MRRRGRRSGRRRLRKPRARWHSRGKLRFGWYRAAVREQLLVRDGNRCSWCGEKLYPPMEIDHIWPVSRGGTNRITNLQLLHKKCNRDKGAG